MPVFKKSNKQSKKKKRIQTNLDIKPSKEEKKAIQKKKIPCKENLIYGTNILIRVKSHYLNISISLLLRKIVVSTQLKVKTDFGVETWLISFFKSKHAV